MKHLPSFHSIACSIAIAAVASAGGGCASKHPPAFTGSSTSLSTQAKSAEADGVRVTAEVFTDRDRCDKYFHLPNAYAKGLAIVYVKVENLHASESLLAQLPGIHLLQGGNRTATGNTAQSTAGAEATAILGATLLSGPLLFVGGAMISSAAMIQENFVTKEFRNDTVSPGGFAEGFAYFQLNKETLLKEGGTVRVIVRRPLSRTDVTVEIPLPKL